MVSCLVPQALLGDLALSEVQRAGVEGLLAAQQVQFEMRLANQHSAIESRLSAEIEARLQAKFEERLQAELDVRVQALYEQIRLARARMFGRSSESHAGQGWLFNEA